MAIKLPDMKYIINYVLFMAFCAVISLFYKNDVHSSSLHPIKTSHNIISDTTNTDYWGLQTNVLPAFNTDDHLPAEHSAFTSYLGTTY